MGNFMKIFLLVLNFILGIIGWFKPETASEWLQILIIFIMLLILIFEILLELKTTKEASKMRTQLVEIYASETARATFELYINRTQINSREQYISLPEKNGQLKFELILKNIGNATATNVQVFLWMPEKIQNPFLGRHWIFNGIPTKLGNSNNDFKGIKEYVFISPVAINVKNWLILGHGRLPLFQKGLEVPFRLKVYASGGIFQEWTFIVKQ